MIVSDSDILKHWRVTHFLDGCLTILVSGSDLSSSGEQLTSWMHVHPFLSVVLICSSCGERLTAWMCVHPCLSMVLICTSNGEGLTAWMHVHPFLSVILICSNIGERPGLTAWMQYSPILISGSDLPKHWRVTHRLDKCSPILVSRSGPLKLQSDSLARCDFTHSCQWL